MAFVIYTPKLQRVVDTVIAPGGFSVDTPQHRQGKSTLTQQVAAPVAESVATQGYRGYFMLEKIEQENGKLRVRIYDGAHDFSDMYLMPCKVNTRVYRVYYWDSGELEANGNALYFWLKFTANINTDVTEEDTSKVEIIVTETDVMTDSYKNVYYLLGRLIRDENATAYIVQDHHNSIPQLLWFTSCV